MKMLFRVLLFLTICTPGLMAQKTDSRVLLTINGNEITTGEYMWLYEKNNSGENKSSIEEYLDLYTLFKMKVEAAKEEGLHLSKSFNDELGGYRKQLARNYLTDQEIKEELLLNAFERSKEEINVYHILIRCAADASPADTIEAYNKALDIRERIRLGESFMAVAKGASDDPTARFNGGKLGYLTVFQTPLNFENVVYSMQAGNLSKPVRTSEGYHIIKVQDRRPNSGKVKVAHIMKASPPGSSEMKISGAKAEIDSIYNMVVAGNNFENLAREYSEDKGSSGAGGELPWFGVGEMIHEFSEESFKLLRNGDISQPFRTMYGWHIIKRTGRQAPLPYEEQRKVLEGKMSHSYLESLSKKSFVDKLKEEYNFMINTNKLEWFYSIADSVFRSGDYQWEEKSIPRGNLYTYSDRSVSMKDFSDFINLMGERAFSDDSIRYINTLVELKSYDDLVKYEDSVLEEKYPEFGYLMKEFYDGILLFEISNKKIWSKISTDSTGLKNYWETRKTEFLSKATIDARIITISSEAGRSRTKKLTRELKKLIRTDAGDEQIKERGRAGNRQLVEIESATFIKGDNRIIDNVKWSKGTSIDNDKNGTYIVYISEVKEAQPFGYDEAKSYLIDDYQALLEKDWYQQLREKYDVKINDSVLQSLMEENR